VPEAYTAGVTNGTSLTFTVAAYAGQTFTGTVARISQSVDEPHQRSDAGYESPGADADAAGGARRSRPEEAYAGYDQHSCTRPHTS
jgi:hypothetical protein